MWVVLGWCVWFGGGYIGYSRCSSFFISGRCCMCIVVVWNMVLVSVGVVVGIVRKLVLVGGWLLLVIMIMFIVFGNCVMVVSG